MTSLVVFVEQRASKDHDGHLVGRKELTAVASLAGEAAVTVVARDGDDCESDVALLPGSRSRGVILPWPRGGFNTNVLLTFVRGARQVVTRHSAVVVYLPGVAGSIGTLLAVLHRKPLVAIVVGDPRHALSAEVIPGLRGIAIRQIFVAATRFGCRRAAITRYVTQDYLQRHYPPRRNGETYAASDIGSIPFGTPRRWPGHDGVVVLTVASMDQPYKGVDDLVAAVGMLGHVTLRIAGAGRLVSSYRALADRLAPGRVQFLGHLGPEDLAAAYLGADLFALPSWTEGMPRAVVEAMAAGLPVVATAVGGIPEIIDAACLVPPRDVHALAATMSHLMEDRDLWEKTTRRNLAVATAFVAEAARVETQFVGAVHSLIGQS